MAKPETNLKTIVLEEYYDFLNIFLVKNFNIFLLYQKYDYKIILKEKQKHNDVFLYKMSLQELDAVKCYLDLYLAKRVI